jgi:hypothetical protein
MQAQLVQRVGSFRQIAACQDVDNLKNGILKGVAYYKDSHGVMCE